MSPSGIVAVYYSNRTKVEYEKEVKSRYDDPEKQEEVNKSTAFFEYFDTDAFRDFLYKREKPDDGVLQKFVHPKGEHNSTIQIVWSPKVNLFE